MPLSINNLTIGSGITISVSPVLVTQDLLLNFDAATYSGTGNWIDEVSGVQAVPSNSPTWSSTNGGTFVLSAPSVPIENTVLVGAVLFQNVAAVCAASVVLSVKNLVAVMSL
jgi:hypothetical protein